MDRSFAYPEYLSYRVKRLYLLISQRIDDALKPYGIARSQWQVLSRVSRAGTLTQKDLQHAMQVESATLTCIVDVLVARAGWRGPGAMRTSVSVSCDSRRTVETALGASPTPTGSSRAGCCTAWPGRTALTSRLCSIR